MAGNTPQYHVQHHRRLFPLISFRRMENLATQYRTIEIKILRKIILIFENVFGRGESGPLGLLNSTFPHRIVMHLESLSRYETL